MSSKRAALAALAVVALTSSLSLPYAFFASDDAQQRLAAAAPQQLTVQVDPQPQSPLQISSTNILSSDPLGPRVEFTITNTGGKAIRAFTVGREVVTDAGSRRAAKLTNLTTQRKVLQPGGSTSDVVNEPDSPVPVNSIILSIDFVEFADGETWGEDKYNSAERLAGQRAGGRAAYSYFRRLREQAGPKALLEAVEAEGEAPAAPQQHSPEWQDGFRTGFGLVRIRLNRARQEGGLNKVELELQQPYDTSEGRP